MTRDLDSAINGLVSLMQVAGREVGDARRQGLNPTVIEWKVGYFHGLRQGLTILEALGKKAERRRRRKAVAA